MGWKYAAKLKSPVFYQVGNFSSCHKFSRVAKSISKCWFCISAIVIIYWSIFSFPCSFSGPSFPRSSIFLGLFNSQFYLSYLENNFFPNFCKMMFVSESIASVEMFLAGYLIDCSVMTLTKAVGMDMSDSLCTRIKYHRV